MSGKIPEIDLSGCVVCQGCHEVCPDVFLLNACGFMEVADLEDYPEDLHRPGHKPLPKGLYSLAQGGPEGQSRPGRKHRGF